MCGTLFIKLIPPTNNRELQKRVCVCSKELRTECLSILMFLTALADLLHRYEILTEILLKMKLFRPKPATP